MSDRHEQIAHMLLADAPAARDLAFEVAMLARLEQRRFRRSLMRQTGLVIMATLLLGLLIPGIQDFWQQRLAGALDNWMIAALLFSIALPVQSWIARRA